MLYRRRQQHAQFACGRRPAHRHAFFGGMFHAVAISAIARSTGQDIIRGNFALTVISALLLLFYSSTEKKLVTLAEYVDRMKEDQKFIYFATGENAAAIDALPQTELLQSKGFEILYCTEDVDEFTLQSLMMYKEKRFCSATNDDLGIENDETKEDEKDSSALLTFVKETLGDKVAEVTASKKLVSHPVCLTAKGGISFEMEKYFNSVQPESGMMAQRVLELNMSHSAVKTMESLIQTDIDKARKYAEVLYCQALLIAGLPLENPSEYTDLVCSLI